MLRNITCAFALLALSSGPLAARADDSKRLLSEQHFTALRSFTLSMVFHSPKGEVDKTLTYVAPDRLRLDIPARKLAAVTIGHSVWVRDPENKWHKQEAPLGTDPMAVVHSFTEVAKSIKDKTVTYVGSESLDGVPTHVFRLEVPPKHGFSAISEKLWLGTDGFPRKIEQKNGPFSMRATYANFNAPLSVGL